MKKIIALTLAIVMCFCTACFSANAEIVNVGFYQDWDFYGLSTPEYIPLQLNSDSISFWAECTNTPDEPELLICVVMGITNSAYSNSFEFYADGSVTTYPYGFPAGLYKIFFVGDSDVEKSEAIAIFTKVD